MRIRCTNPVLLVYLTWAYLLPAALNWWTDYESDIYVNPSNGFWTWLYGGILFLITAVFAFSVKVPSERRYSEPEYETWNVPVRTIVTILFATLVISLIGVTSGLSRWRYADEGLSSSLGPTQLMFVLAPSILELVLFAFLFFKYELPLRTERAVLVLLAVCLGLTAGGIGPMLAVLLALVAALAPDTLRQLILVQPARQARTRHSPLVYRLLLLSPIVVVLGVVGYLVGDAIKTGSGVEDSLDNLEQDGVDLFLNYLVGRLSVQWYSLAAALHQYVELGQSDQFQNLLAPITNAGFRMSSLLGGMLGIDRPLDGSLSRINYNIINLYPFNDREGTSPGLLGSFVLSFPIWLGPFALTAYLSLYNRIQKGLRRRMAGRPTWIGEILLLYFTAVFFSSPLDFLLLFDPMLLTVGVLGYMAYKANQLGGTHGGIRQNA